MTTPGQLPLNETLSVVLDGSGDGYVRFTPRGEKWYPTLVSVKVSTQTAEAQCRIFAGPASTDDNYVDGTLSGSTGDSTDRVTGYVIAAGQTPYVFAVWSGGDAGAQATAVLNGTKAAR